MAVDEKTQALIDKTADKAAKAAAKEVANTVKTVLDDQIAQAKSDGNRELVKIVGSLKKEIIAALKS